MADTLMDKPTVETPSTESPNTETQAQTQETTTPEVTTTQFSWKSNLPDQYKTEKMLDSFKDDKDGFNNFTKSFIEAQKFVGGSVRIPKDDAPKEEWDKFYSKMGRPETPDNYDLAWPDLPEIFNWTDATKESLLRQAHEMGLTKKQAQGWLDWSYRSAQNIQAQVDEMGTKTSSELKSEWKGAFDRNLGLAQRALEEVAGEDLADIKEALRSTGLGNNKAVLKMFNRIGKMLLEDQYISDDFIGMPSRDEAKSKAKELMNSDDYWNDKSPKHKDIVAEVAKLLQHAHD